MGRIIESWTNIISFMLRFFPQTSEFFAPIYYKNCSVLKRRRLPLDNKHMIVLRFFEEYTYGLKSNSLSYQQ